MTAAGAAETTGTGAGTGSGDAKGEELPLADGATVTGVRGDKVARLDPRKLSPGHYVAGGKLTAGEWVFDFDSETKGGDAVIVCFEDVVR